MNINRNVSTNLDFVKSKYRYNEAVKKASCKIELYYPNDPIKEYLKDNTISLFVSLFGGCSEIGCTGYYRNTNNEVDLDNISIIYSYAEVTSADIKKVITHAKNLCSKLMQECILLVINDKPYFYKRR